MLSREDLDDYKDILLGLVKNYYYHVNAIELIREKDNTFDKVYSSFRSFYGYKVKVWCENDFESGCAKEKTKRRFNFSRVMEASFYKVA